MFVVYPPSLTATANSADVSTPARSVSTDTPFHLVSSFVHFVTQWMSTAISSCGSLRNSSHVHFRGSSISPTMLNDQPARSGLGVGPAESTGKSVTTCWPGGTRELLASSRLLPRNPREMNATADLLVDGARSLKHGERRCGGCEAAAPRDRLRPPRPQTAWRRTAARTGTRRARAASRRRRRMR